MTKTFKNGVHPHYFKELSSHKASRKIALPDKLEISLSQHLGSPSESVVIKGDEVIPGQLIGKDSGFISALIHSPVFGKISKITPKPQPGGKMANVIEIEVNKEKQAAFSWPTKRKSFTDINQEALLAIVKESGIVGMGGATFPTHVKYMPPKGKVIDTFIVNGAECEPFLSCDHRMMLERGNELVLSLQLIQKLFPLKKIAIGIEANKKDALEHLTNCSQEHKIKVDIIPLQVKYPQGAEKMLIKAVSGRIVPSGKLPLDIGVVVSNVGTLLALYDAVVYGKPLVDRMFTVSGDCVKTSENLIAPIGTTLDAILKEVEVDFNKVSKILFGGPMMGVALPSYDYSIMKGTSGILFLSDELSKVYEESPCIRCGKCVSVCPMNLMPNKLAAYSKFKMWDEVKQVNPNDCMECGCCAYSCPAHIDIVSWIRFSKNYIRIKGL